MNNSKTASILKGEILGFADNISAGLSKPEKKAIRELLLGMIGRGSCLVTEISRGFKDTVRFKKVLERLSRHLSKPGLGEKLQLNYLNAVKRHIKKETLICVDYTTIVKEYARVQENLCRVYDCATNSTHNGFWQMEVSAIDSDRKKYLPLYSRLHSQRDEKFTSENSETYRTLDVLRDALSDRGIYLFDRGFDRNRIYEKLINLKNRFIVRLKGNRHLLYGTRGKSKNVLKLAKKVRCQVRETVKFTRKGRQIVTQMDYGSRKVKLPSLPDVELNLVVIKNLRGEVKAIFLTNLACGSRKNLNMVVKGYFLRWTVEEIIRFRKQEFDLENIRVRSWVKLQNLTTLALISAGKVGLQSFNELISRHILTFAKRANGIKRFSLYAVMEGISFLLTHFMITRKTIPKPCCNQLTLFEISHFSLLESL